MNEHVDWCQGFVNQARIFEKEIAAIGFHEEGYDPNLSWVKAVACLLRWVNE